MPHASLVVVASDQQPTRTPQPAIMPASSMTALRILATLKGTPTATEWLAASGLPRRTFFDARDDLERREYVGRDSAVQRGAHYAVTEAGDKVLSAMVRIGCDEGATALSTEEESQPDEGAKRAPAPIRGEEVANRELFGTADGAAGGDVYTPPHLRTYRHGPEAKGA